jgi:hypothetical protein
MQPKSLGLLLLTCLLFIAGPPAQADDQWRSRAHIDSAAPGIFEAIVPPELVNLSESQQMDLTLNGPDLQPRAFELYWREPVGELRHTLTPSRVQLDPNQVFIWEADIPEKLDVKSLHVKMAGQNIIGSIDVEGFGRGGWSLLVRHAAVFKTNGGLSAQIAIPKARYDKLRLRLSGYDQRARQALSPIETVVAVGDRQGKDFAEQLLPIAFVRSQSEEAVIIEAALPGDGLWIQSLTISTQAQFQGAWQVGREIITDGRKRFTTLLSGTMQHVGPTPQRLAIDVQKQWPGRSLVIKLYPGDRYIGAISTIEAMVRLPRMVFAADKAGRYTAFSGAQKKVRVLAHPGNTARQAQMQLAFTAPEINPQWRLVSLLEKYQLKGGPFDPQGYTWRSPITIATPGYYRLPLNLEASLKPHPAAIRIVKDNTQVPYITGRVDNQTIDLDTGLTYEADSNTTQGIVRLPQASAHWQQLTLHATGLFKRRVELQQPKPGNLGWQSWQHATWESRGEQATALRLSLRNFPTDANEIRLVIDHGDNQPVTISKITASYSAPTIYFLAHAAGEYLIYGGNPQATAPQYDLSLVQAELQADLPAQATMGALDPFNRPGWKNRLNALFKDTGWGLYAVLALVTVVLLTVIVRLFPKPANDPRP